MVVSWDKLSEDAKEVNRRSAEAAIEAHRAFVTKNVKGHLNLAGVEVEVEH